MKRLDINITDKLDQALNELKKATACSKTELVHDAVVILLWVKQVREKGHEVGEIDPSTNEVVAQLFMPVFASIDKGVDENLAVR